MSLRQDLKGDWGSIFLLLLLYTMQGIPIGLAMSIPMLLAEHKTSYDDQATFSLATWPFSLKLLWAPIVDSTFSDRFGRRKSWLIPTQLLIGCTMLWMSSSLKTWVPDGGEPHIYTLTGAAFWLFFLTATQDIAVDGWGLTMVKPKNVGYVSSCNTIGQQVGFLLAYVVFLALASPSFCNSWIRSQPQDEPLVTLDGFLFFWGIVFLVVTTMVAVFKREKSMSESLAGRDTDATTEEPPADSHSVDIGEQEKELELTPAETYKLMGKMSKLRYAVVLFFMLMTCKVGSAPASSLSSLKLVEKGVDKQFMGMLAMCFAPVEIMATVLLSKWIAGSKPIMAWFYAFPVNALSCFLVGGIVWLLPALSPGEALPWQFWVFGLPVMISNSIARTLQFVSIMAFFTHISDPLFGGTNMTVWNTIANMGGNWPNYLVLKLVEKISWETCETGTTTAGELKRVCNNPLDGFVVLIACGAVYSLVWMLLMRKKIQQLAVSTSEDWRIGSIKKA